MIKSKCLFLLLYYIKRNNTHSESCERIVRVNYVYESDLLILHNFGDVEHPYPFHSPVLFIIFTLSITTLILKSKNVRESGSKSRKERENRMRDKVRLEIMKTK